MRLSRASAIELPGGNFITVGSGNVSGPQGALPGEPLGQGCERNPRDDIPVHHEGELEEGIHGSNSKVEARSSSISLVASLANMRQRPCLALAWRRQRSGATCQQAKRRGALRLHERAAAPPGCWEHALPTWVGFAKNTHFPCGSGSPPAFHQAPSPNVQQAAGHDYGCRMECFTFPVDHQAVVTANGHVSCGSLG